MSAGETQQAPDMHPMETEALMAYRAQFGVEPETVASAPGRVNLIGDHTDYNLGFVLPMAIEQRVAVAAGAGSGGLLSLSMQELLPLRGDREKGWVAFPRGVAQALTDSGYTVPPFQAAIAGNVPLGSGLSSSAAIEAATITALNAMHGWSIPRRQQALICQRAENVYVGINSGIMDQYASLLCEAGSALFIDCRTLEAETVPLNLGDHTFVIIDTGGKRELTASGYNDRRATTERAAELIGVTSLREATMADLEGLHGVELRRARHVITENQRVLDAVAALRAGDLGTFGQLMTASHNSLRDDYEVSTPALDTAVEAALEAGALGARLTGAGFGGCAVALTANSELERLRESVSQAFAARSYGEPRFLPAHPSPGARSLTPRP